MDDNFVKLEKRLNTLANTLAQIQSDYEDKVMELSLLRKIADLFAYEFDVKEACKKIVQLLYEEFYPENCSVYLYNETVRKYELAAIECSKKFEKPVVARFNQTKLFSSDEGAAGWAIQNKKIIFIPDVEKDVRFAEIKDSKVSIGSLVCIPLLNQDKVEGFANLSHSKKDAFSKTALNLFNILMKDIGIALGNIRVLNEYTETNISLNKSNKELNSALEDLRKTRNYILQTERLSGIGILAAGIAHEFNNILAGVVGYSELSLLTNNVGDISNNLKSVLKLANKGSNVVNDLLSFAGEGKSMLVQTNINKQIEAILNLIETELDNYDIEIHKELTEVPEIKCDPEQIAQVILQVISNSKDSMMYNGGKLTIKTLISDKNLVVEIADNGNGMDEEIMKTIFDPFVTTKGALSGGDLQRKGLGLSIAFGIIKNHGGDIKIDSKPGHGCKVQLLLPIEQH